MVLAASGAVNFTNTAIENSNTFDVTNEVNLAEAAVYSSAALGLFTVLYNARIIGNPIGNPEVADNLTENQQSFYGVFISAGYLLNLDVPTGRWAISWSPTGPETAVNVYSFRTTIVPTSPIITITINTVKTFFKGQIPTINSVVVSDGTLSESVFGGSGTTFYEYTIVANQSNMTTDYSSQITSALLGAGVGYESGNCGTYKLV